MFTFKNLVFKDLKSESEKKTYPWPIERESTVLFK